MKENLRKKLKNNIINNCLLRVDFMKIENIERVLIELKKIMEPEGYFLTTTQSINVNINIDDPEILLSQEAIKRNITKTQNYEFCNSKGRFILNEYVLIFENHEFKYYEGIEKYINLFESIFSKIIELETIDVLRLGLRKQNNILVSTDYDFEKIIGKNKLPQINEEDKSNLDEIQNIRKILDKNGVSLNSNIEIKRGKIINVNNEEYTVFCFLIDIDCYKRDVKNQNIKKEIEELNNTLFDKFYGLIGEDLMDKLMNENLDEKKLLSEGIYGGIKCNGKVR